MSAQPASDQESYEAALVAQVRNATVAECQRWLRDAADQVERLTVPLGLPPQAADHYRSAANLIGVLRWP